MGPRWCNWCHYYFAYNPALPPQWSLGVTLWEIYSMCVMLPYCEVSDDLLLDHLTSGAGNLLSTTSQFCQHELVEVSS